MLRRIEVWQVMVADGVAPTFTASTFMRKHLSTFGYRLSAGLLLSLITLGIASGQTPPAGRFAEPLEKYDMPPMYIFRPETSARMVSQYGPFVSYQVNVDQN